MAGVWLITTTGPQLSVLYTALIWESTRLSTRLGHNGVTTDHNWRLRVTRHQKLFILFFNTVRKRKSHIVSKSHKVSNYVVSKIDNYISRAHARPVFGETPSKLTRKFLIFLCLIKSSKCLKSSSDYGACICFITAWNYWNMNKQQRFPAGQLNEGKKTSFIIQQSGYKISSVLRSVWQTERLVTKITTVSSANWVERSINY